MSRTDGLRPSRCAFLVAESYHLYVRAPSRGRRNYGPEQKHLMFDWQTWHKPGRKTTLPICSVRKPEPSAFAAIPGPAGASLATQERREVQMTFSKHTARLFTRAATCIAVGAATAALTGTLLAAATRPARAADKAGKADKLLFCNSPEKIRMGGAHADAPLKAGQTYRVFYHYRNGTRATGPLVVAFQSSGRGKPVTLTVQKGTGNPQKDPSEAGRQAMSRFLKSPAKRYVGRGGNARFPVKLKPLEVASGVFTVRPDQDVRLRIYFRHNKYTVAGARVVAVDAPRRDYMVTLAAGAKRQQYFRIGVPEPGMSKHLGGTYGLVYSFKVSAPPGSKVRVAFSPRGGKAGLVGTVGGVMQQSRIVGAAAWSAFTEAVVGKDGLVVTTLPFGGVFYPVELVFQLL